MARFVVRGSDPDEPATEFWLTKEGEDEIRLSCRRGDSMVMSLLRISPHGVLMSTGVKGVGIKVDQEGKLYRRTWGNP